MLSAARNWVSGFIVFLIYSSAHITESTPTRGSPLLRHSLVSRMPKWQQQQQQHGSLLACPLFRHRVLSQSCLLSFIYLSSYLTFFCAVDLPPVAAQREWRMNRGGAAASSLSSSRCPPSGSFLRRFPIYIRSLNSMKNAKTLHSKVSIKRRHKAPRSLLRRSTDISLPCTICSG